MAFDVSVFFHNGQQWIDCAWTEVHAELFAQAGYYLVSVHGMGSQELKDYEVKEAPHEFHLNLPNF
jgi:hypothetical protein